MGESEEQPLLLPERHHRHPDAFGPHLDAPKDKHLDERASEKRQHHRPGHEAQRPEERREEGHGGGRQEESEENGART